MKTNDIWLDDWIRLADGHRLFQARTPHDEDTYADFLPSELLNSSRGIWAIADNSGGYPQDTDDGVLWLDFTRDLWAGTPINDDGEGTVPGIPLMDEDGKKHSTITDTVTLLWLSVRFNWPIDSAGTIIQAMEV